MNTYSIYIDGTKRYYGLQKDDFEMGAGYLTVFLQEGNKYVDIIDNNSVEVRKEK